MNGDKGGVCKSLSDTNRRHLDDDEFDELLRKNGVKLDNDGNLVFALRTGAAQARAAAKLKANALTNTAAEAQRLRDAVAAKRLRAAAAAEAQRFRDAAAAADAVEAQRLHDAAVAAAAAVEAQRLHDAAVAAAAAAAEAQRFRDAAVAAAEAHAVQVLPVDGELSLRLQQCSLTPHNPYGHNPYGGKSKRKKSRSKKLRKNRRANKTRRYRK
jgi:hypothetical protein